jgi:hypothetical protein
MALVASRSRGGNGANLCRQSCSGRAEQRDIKRPTVYRRDRGWRGGEEEEGPARTGRKANCARGFGLARHARVGVGGRESVVDRGSAIGRSRDGERWMPGRGSVHRSSHEGCEEGRKPRGGWEGGRAGGRGGEEGKGYEGGEVGALARLGGPVHCGSRAQTSNGARGSCGGPTSTTGVRAHLH